MTTFFFVRHALTAHTGSKLSGRAPGVHLSEEGMAQAEAVAEQLAGVPFKGVYASPIERAMETARPIARRHDMEVVIRRGLGEVEFGRWTNRTFTTLRRTRLWSTVQRVPSAVTFPEGESLRAVQARAVEEVEDLRSHHRKDVVCCVSHADVIKLVLAHYLGIHIDLFQRMVVGPASISIVSLGADGPSVMAVNVPADGQVRG